jgi:hypothetical protein
MLLGLLRPAAAQDAPPAVTIAKVSAPPRIEDYLDGEADPSLAVTDFRQRRPLDLAPASESTTAWLSYDDDHLYAVFVSRASNPGQVRARMARREQANSDDQVGLYIDTFLDRQRSYIFLSNPLGIQADGIQSEGGFDDFSFDAQWRSEGRVTDFGYVVRFDFQRVPDRSAGASRSTDRSPLTAKSRTSRRSATTSAASRRSLPFSTASRTCSRAATSS